MTEAPWIKFHHELVGVQIEMRLHGTALFMTPDEMKTMRDRLTVALASLRTNHKLAAPHTYREPHPSCTYCGRLPQHRVHKEPAP